MEVRRDISVIELKPIVSAFGLLSNAFTDKILSRAEYGIGHYRLVGLQYLEDTETESSPFTANIDLSLSFNTYDNINSLVSQIFQGGGNSSEFALRLAKTLTAYSFRGNILTSAHALQVANSLITRIFEGRRHSATFAMKLASALTSQSFKGNRLTSAHALTIANTIVSHIFRETNYNTVNVAGMANTITSQILQDKKITSAIGLNFEDRHYHNIFETNNMQYEQPAYRDLQTVYLFEEPQPARMAASQPARIADWPINISLISQYRKQMHSVSESRNYSEHLQKYMQAIPPETLRELHRASTLAPEAIREIVNISARSPEAILEFHRVSEVAPEVIRELHRVSEVAPEVIRELHRVSEPDRETITQIIKAADISAETLRDIIRLSSIVGMLPQNTITAITQMLTQLTHTTAYPYTATNMLQGDRLTSTQSFELARMLMSKIFQGDRLSSSQSFMLSSSLTSKIQQGDRLTSAQSFHVTDSLTSKVMEGDRFSSAQSADISNTLALKVLEGDRFSSIHALQVAGTLTSKLLQGDRLSTTQSFAITNPLVSMIFNRSQYSASQTSRMLRTVLPPNLFYSESPNRQSRDQSRTAPPAPSVRQESVWKAPGYDSISQTGQRHVTPPQMEYKTKEGRPQEQREKLTGTEVKVLANKVYDILGDRISREKRRLGL